MSMPLLAILYTCKNTIAQFLSHVLLFRLKQSAALYVRFLLCICCPRHCADSHMNDTDSTFNDGDDDGF